MNSIRALISGLALGLSIVAAVQADEGMWLFNNPPTALWKEKYNFEPTPQWLELLQKASVRFSSGGSGSFLSANGLVITNHHVGADTLQKLSNAEHNYLRDGFYGKTQAEEQPALDLELNVLDSIEEVTARVNGAVKAGLDSTAAMEARRAIIAQIEKESLDQTGLRSNVITLYEGGSYQLYRYKVYTDVRLVFAPEQQAAFYGGDPDNFEYPRYGLDICVFRAYEKGKPAQIEHFLTVNPNGPSEGDLIFLIGNPGRTNRGWTVYDLIDERDRLIPHWLEMNYRREVALMSFSERSFENARRARDELFFVRNFRKAFLGMQGGLLDPVLFARLQSAEIKLRQEMQARAAKDAQFAGALAAFEKIKTAQSAITKNAPLYDYYESEPWQFEIYHQPRGFACTLFGYARLLVRGAEERNKPNSDRLPPFQESSREALELNLFSTQPIYDDLEELRLTDSLTDLATQFGADDSLVRQILAGKAPAERAAELVTRTKLKDLEFRKKMYAADSAAIKAADDPLMNLALLVDPTARKAGKVFDTNDEIRHQAYAEIAKARYAIQGTTTYPDATFTPRIAYGTVSAYEVNGQRIPPFTDFAGLYARSADHENRAPFDLPKRWVEHKDRLNLGTKFNFVCDTDCTLGNSGSPLVNRAGEFVGILFDSNLQGLVLTYIYDNKQARSVAVDSAAISEALRKVYDAGTLADEIEGRTTLSEPAAKGKFSH